MWAANWPRALHVPHSDWLASVLQCDNQPDDDEKAAREKRRLAVNFYDLHGPGRLAEHADDDIAWLLSPGDLHLPLVPAIILTL